MVTPATSITGGSGEAGAITLTLPSSGGIANAITSAPAAALAAANASRRVQLPGVMLHTPSSVSAVELTVKVAAVADPAASTTTVTAAYRARRRCMHTSSLRRSEEQRRCRCAADIGFARGVAATDAISRR